MVHHNMCAEGEPTIWPISQLDIAEDAATTVARTTATITMGCAKRRQVI
jgi:hypothetical protein